VITVENLSKSFSGRTGPVVALDDVSLNVATGTVAGVVGPSGSGKSTLARLLALQDRPDSGVIRFAGQNTAGLDPRRLRVARSRIGVVPAGESLLAARTAAGNIALPLEQAGMDGPQRRERVGTLLDLIGLTDRAATHPEALTAGQRRRVAVARALVGEPDVLLADDPTAGVDADGAAGVLAVLDRARAELGTTIVVATSDPGVVRKIADDVAILEHGRILETGGLLDLVHNPTSLVVDALLPALDTALPVPDTDRVAEVILVGFAAVGALLPEAANRFDVDIAVVGGGLTRIGDTPVARFRLGVTGERADAAIGWIGERGGVIRSGGPQKQFVAA
jgi:D-methionine transport system ATP-binding protein